MNKILTLGVNVAVGFIEEIIFNVTSVSAANVGMMPESFKKSFLDKER